ncbi:MAG: hypothetical protein ACYCZT_10450 [Thiobacillus sp.]
MMLTAAALDSVAPALLLRGFRLDEIRQQSLRRLLRILHHTKPAE